MVNPKRPDEYSETEELDTEGHGPVRNLVEDDEDTEGHGPVRNLVEDDEDTEGHGPVRN